MTETTMRSLYALLRDETRRVFTEHPECSGVVAGLAWAAMMAARQEGVSVDE